MHVAMVGKEQPHWMWTGTLRVTVGKRPALLSMRVPGAAIGDPGSYTTALKPRGLAHRSFDGSVARICPVLAPISVR